MGVLSFGRTVINMMNLHLLFDKQENIVTKYEEKAEVLNYFLTQSLRVNCCQATQLPDLPAILD